MILPMSHQLSVHSIFIPNQLKNGNPNSQNFNFSVEHSNFTLNFSPSLSRKNHNCLTFPNRKLLWLCTPKTPTFPSATASDSPSYGGWDDPRLGKDSVDAGEYTQLRNFLISLGIDDRKYIFVYLLGFVCALAISRVRVSSIVVFPACAIVFAVGFSVGFVNGGHMNEMSLIGTQKRPIVDEKIRVSVEKLKSLVFFFDGFDGEVHNLIKDINKSIDCNQISANDLKRYVNIMESIGLSAKNASSVVEACIDNLLVENQELERTLNQKSGKRRKEVGEKSSRFDLFQIIGGLFRENMVGSKPRNKECIKRDSAGIDVNDQSRKNVLTSPVEERVVNSVSNSIKSNDQSRGNLLASPVEERVVNSVPNGNLRNGYAGFSGETSNKLDTDYGGIEYPRNENERIYENVQHDKKNFARINGSGKRVFDSGEYTYRNNGLQFMGSRQISRKIGQNNEVERWASGDNLLDSVDLIANLRMETEETFGKEMTFEKSDGNYEDSYKTEKSENGTYKSLIKEKSTIPEDNFGFSPSSTVSDDMIFNTCLMDASGLLKQARECLRHKDDIELAENVLNKSAKLLSRAIDMKPMSLLAVGQLGNTYLLHGELKLMMSRDLRALLERSDPISVENWSKVVKGLDDRLASKDKIATALVNVCEECEELLVESGRKYRLALSIDGNDMRALYNWGLALSFRAQLIADIGPEAAFDADKVFLAAIDKFDAMMSKSNAYAPDALFRWGVALQQRSRLRPRNSKEKVKLLQQAKRLYEDALDMDSNSLQLREALSSCISELNFRNY